MNGVVYPLKDSQKDAVNPRLTTWLSASAGTGKTQVLSARVLRHLLEPGVEPSQILCLTFTKAGAAEMAVRINDVLARWVRLPDGELGTELKYIGAALDPDTREKARTLFASVLDCPGGGLKINTMHAFSQWLLGSFPEEAGLPAGARPMEDRDRDLLAHQVLFEMLDDAQSKGDRATLDAVSAFSLAKGEDKVLPWLLRCAGASSLWFGPGAWQPPLRPRINRLLGLEVDATAADAARLCSDAHFDVAALRQCLEIVSGWSTKSGKEMAAGIGSWLAADEEERLRQLPDLRALLTSKEGAPKQLRYLDKIDPAYSDYWARVNSCMDGVKTFIKLLELGDFLEPAFSMGRTFALRWNEAKQREGFVDFDDQIRLAAELLGRRNMADWIRYKLDRQFDHILIDEAQDTNKDQWDIVFALIDDFFAGEGAHGDKLRTVFTVGDYKQAIYGFQGTSPENFEAAKVRVREQMREAAQNALESRRNAAPKGLQDLGLGRSFRTSQPVLGFVDKAIDAIGHHELGLKTPSEPHIGSNKAGLVTLWPLIVPENADEEDAGYDSSAEDSGEDNWLGEQDRRLADMIARQVRAWLDEGYPLEKHNRNATAGDIMILVRTRAELAGLIVARLHAQGVPVAGVDRLRLGNPLAVKDLLAALRFAAQPLDDLNLANLLVSPLIGWSQEQLLRHGWREKHVRLWAHLRMSSEPEVLATLQVLGDLLALADFEPPQALLHWILTGPWQGRRKLVARLGREANDPIDELLNSAIAFTSAHTASLQGFLQWFDSGSGEIKRDAETAADQVRVMTVHGSKGLQAPIVILADAATAPSSNVTLELVEPVPGQDDGLKVPLPALKKDDKVGRLAALEQDALGLALQESWRLLYVAMTRAEEALFIGGALKKSQARKGPSENSWYARLRPLFETEPLEDPIWGLRWEQGHRADPITEAGEERTPPAHFADLPDWVHAPIGPEPRPPRPLAPSAAGEDLSPDPPAAVGDAQARAARRGTLIHKLLERLPGVEADLRAVQAEGWLARQAADIAVDERDSMIRSALAVIEDPQWADFFGPNSLAEVPFAAVVEGQVVAGTVDRLSITKDRVLVVDFKTARRPPAGLEDVPVPTLRQMAAYHAALSNIYPNRQVEIALLYTHEPKVIHVPQDILQRHKLALQP